MTSIKGGGRFFSGNVLFPGGEVAKLPEGVEWKNLMEGEGHSTQEQNPC